MSSSPKDPSKNKPEPKRLPYRKPVIRTESLTAVAAVCNGTSGGGRKASTSAPALCTASKLKS